MTEYEQILGEMKPKAIRYTVELRRTDPSKNPMVKWIVYYETNYFVANGEERWDDWAVKSAGEAIERDIPRRG